MDYARLRDGIKQHALDHLDFYLAQFTANVRRKGGHVHFAADGAEARKIILKIVKNTPAAARDQKQIDGQRGDSTWRRRWRKRELDVVETDLGEFIIQISDDKPSHLVAPIIHKDRASIGKLFSRIFRHGDDDRCAGDDGAGARAFAG